MYICSDVAKERYISVYWEENQLFFVVKKVRSNGQLEEQIAVAYTPDEAREFLVECQNSATIHGAELTPTNVIGVAGQIAEGLRDGPSSNSTSRISPDMWN